MITFEGRQRLLKSADMIGRKASETYPHISGSQLDIRYRKTHHIKKTFFYQSPELVTKIATKINKIRDKINCCDYYYAALVKEIKKNKVGNCFEDAMLAELVGHINGQDNIHMGNILVKKQNVKKQISIDHAVAFITNKKIRSDKDYTFKNKEAVIIDPWLNIVDFAGNYFTKIKNQYRDCFDGLPNQDFLEYLIGTDAENVKNVKDYRQQKKISCQHLTFSIKPAHSFYWDKDKEDYYRSHFTELIIDKFEKIILPKKKKIKRNNSLNKVT